MILDAIRRIFGTHSRPAEEPSQGSQYPIFSRPRPPSGGNPSHPFEGDMPSFDVFDMDTDLNRIHEFMDGQMRSMMETFTFMFGSPVIGPDDGDRSNPYTGGPFPFSFGIPGLPDFPRSGMFGDVPHSGTHVPALPRPPGNLEPRDEVLKPQLRTIKPDERKDEDLDALVQSQGPGVVLDILKPGPTERREVHSPSSWLWGGSFEPQVSRSSTITIYRNINGHSTYEKIVRHPDGKVDRTVIESEENSNQPSPLET